MDRRKFLKYAGAAAAVAGASALGLDFMIGENLPKQSGITFPDIPSRLLANTTDFKGIQTAIENDSRARSLFSILSGEGQSILKQSPYPFSLCKDQCHANAATILPISRGVVNRIYTLGMLYRLGEGDEFLDRAWQELKTVARYPNWNPSSFLDTAEMTHACAIGYDWFPWQQEQRSIIRDAIVNLGLKPALKAYGGNSEYGWWVNRNHNWNLVCNSGIGLGALAIAPERPDISQQIIEYGFASLPKALESFAPDGGWFEGPVYWNYATLYLSLFLASFQTANATNHILTGSTGLAETGLFPIYCTGPSGHTFNFADAEDSHLQSPQMFWFGREFKRPVYFSYVGGDDLTNGDYVCAGPCLGPALGLLWFEPEMKEPTNASLDPSKYFRGLEVATLRSSWDPNSNYVGLKAGQNGVNHGHLDVGSFVVDAFGIRWAIDLGWDNYSLPGYFDTSGQRWTYYRTRAEGHNTIVLNSPGGPDQIIGAATAISRYKSDPTFSFAIADLAPAYSSTSNSKVKRMLRGAGLSQDHMIVQDEITPVGALDLWWFMHTRSVASIGSDGRTATFSKTGKRLLCTLASPSEADFTLMDAKPLPSSPKPSGQDPNDGVQKLSVHLQVTVPTTIAVLLYPLKSDQEPPSDLPSVTSLSEW